VSGNPKFAEIKPFANVGRELFSIGQLPDFRRPLAPFISEQRIDEVLREITKCENREQFELLAGEPIQTVSGAGWSCVIDDKSVVPEVVEVYRIQQLFVYLLFSFGKVIHMIAEDRSQTVTPEHAIKRVSRFGSVLTTIASKAKWAWLRL